jgi:hypothetical protein
MRNNADRHLDRVIHRTICIAKLAGENYTIQNELAMRTVRRMKPDMTASEALAKVNLLRQRSVDFISLRHEIPE